jgi:diguanylate cyclase (GGDEF)-like protein
MDRPVAAFSSQFHEYYFRKSRWMICIGFVFLGLNYFLSDLYPSSTFGLSPVIPTPVLWAERGVIMPVSFGVALMLAIWGEKRWMQWVVIYGALVVGCAVILGRRFWQLEGGDFSGDYSMYIPCALAALTAIGPRIWIVAAPMLLLNLVSAYYVHGVAPAANFEAIGIGAALAVIAAVNWQLRHIVGLMWEERQHFEGLSRSDPLTGLHNRRAFEEHAGTVLKQAARDGVPVAVAMIDLDCFKSYNDRYGHAAGDRVLAAAGRVLSKQAQRPMDMAARIGGEEFACFWYDVTPEGAQQLGEALVASVRALAMPHEGSTVGSVVTASAGVHHSTPQAARALPALLREADVALYSAKSGGRDRAVLS